MNNKQNQQFKKNKRVNKENAYYLGHQAFEWHERNSYVDQESILNEELLIWYIVSLLHFFHKNPFFNFLLKNKKTDNYMFIYIQKRTRLEREEVYIKGTWILGYIYQLKQSEGMTLQFRCNCLGLKQQNKR